MTTIRIFLALLTLFLPKLAIAGRPCHTCAPVHVAKPVQPITNNQTNTYFTYYFQTNGVPYAQSGATLYQAQGLDRALVLDQSRRLAESATVLTQTAISGHQQLTYEALSLDASQHQQSADAQEFLQFMAAFTQYKAAMRAGNGNGQPLALQAPQTPLGQLVSQRCVKCHTGPDAKGGVDLSDVDNLSLDTLKAAAKAIRSGKMPKDSPLSAEERMLFCEEYTQRLEAGQ